MRQDEFDADPVIDAWLPLLGIELPLDSRVVVKLHLETAARLWRGLRDFPLDDEAEPAPVYTA